MNCGDALVDTLYSSFSSAAPHPSRFPRGRAHSLDQQKRSSTLFDEVELLKVTATRADLDRFNRNVLKLKNRWGLDISASLVVPESEEIRQRLERQRMMRKTDLLDYMFTEKIPFLHDLIMTGEVETQFVRIVGSHDMINAFNRLAEQMLFDKNLSGVSILVTERRKIIVENIMKPPGMPSLSTLDAFLDSIYSADFSKSMPLLHRALVA
jgi:hypothetical protein